MRTVNPAQHAKQRARILEAATVEFAEGGLDGTSTSKICRRAGIGSGTLFHYFRTKRAIFHAVFSDALARNDEVCAQALDEEPETGLDLLLTHLIADFAEPTTPGLVAAAMLQANRDVEFAAMLGKDEELLQHTLATLLGRMVAAGHQLIFPPDRAAHWILRILDATYLIVGDPGFDHDAQTTELRRIVAWLLGR